MTFNQNRQRVRKHQIPTVAWRHQQHVAEILHHPAAKQKKENFRRQEEERIAKRKKGNLDKKENRVIDDAVTSTREKNLFSS